MRKDKTKIEKKKNPDAIAINSTLFLFLWFLYILFKPTAPTIQQNQVYGYKELKVQLQCQSSKPTKKIELKEEEKTLQFCMITANSQRKIQKNQAF